MCFLCDDHHTPIGGWPLPDRPPSYRYCKCRIGDHGYKYTRVSSVGWLIVPHMKRHLTHTITGIVHYGLLGIILDWCSLPPYTIYKAPGGIRIVYRNGQRFHVQGCCVQIHAPFQEQHHYVRRSIRRGAGDLWSYNDIAWTRSRRKLH